MRRVQIGFLAFLALSVASPAAAQISAVEYASGFSMPIGFVQDPTDRTVQFVPQQGGLIRVIKSGVVQATPFIDLTGAISAGGERGLLGFVFPPDAAATGRFFVKFTNPQGHTVVARFKRSGDPLVADPSTRFDLRWNGVGGPAYVEQPFANHNGGHLAFGPDGFLYIGMGDGGSGNDPMHNAQNRQSLLGKFLRIDVSVADGHAIGYVVPPGNPFGADTRPEIWSFGWRNPWRYSFDDPAMGGTGALIAGDVGQSSFEEINYEPPNRGGRNYGWRNREGAHPNVGTLPPAFLPLTDPIHEYGRSFGGSVTGGFVFRGKGMAGNEGRYFFADFVTSRVWSLALKVAPTGELQAVDDLREHTTELGGAANLANVSAFGVDADGELYIVSYSRGRVFKLVGKPQTPTNLRIIR